MHTRSNEMTMKRGQSGTPLSLQANYFRLLTNPQWSLHQYHVSFSPEIGETFIKKGIIRTQKAMLKGYLFDGHTMYKIEQLPDDKLQFIVMSKAGEPIQVTLKYIGIVSMTDSASLQILNIIMRSCLEGLKLQLVGRNFFDAISKLRVSNYNLELWPGYITSIRQHEKDILLCAEITHKVMRTDSVYKILLECIKRSDFRDSFLREVMGMTVLTDYNNKTYRVDDVDFDSSPKKTFETKNGPISFVQYYKQRYNITIHDIDQPMLISRSKAREIRSGQPELIALVPELCRPTGLTEEMRNNFQLMRDMSVHTRLGPETRIQRLLAFNSRLNQTKESQDVLNEWGMKLDKQLVQFGGRTLKPEIIKFGNGINITTNPNADWNNEFRNQKLYSLIRLTRWCLIVSNRSENDAKMFLRDMQKAGRGLGFNISEPET